MISPSRIAALPLLVLCAVVVAVAGCSKREAPPRPAPPAPAVTTQPAAQPKAVEAAVPPRAEPAADGDEAAPVAVADLIETLTKTDDSRTRVVTIDEIATRLRGGLPALDALVAALADTEPRVRWHAARAIGLIGHEAASAIPALLKLLADQDPIVVTQAAAAVGHIRGDDVRAEIPETDTAIYAAAVEPLVQTTVHPDPRARRASVRALKQLSSSPQELAKTVRTQLADADPSVVLTALHTLADMEEDAVPFLLEALSDPKSRFWAEVVLAEIGEEAAAAVGPLAEIAGTGAVEDRVQAILALARIGKPAAAAAPQLIVGQ